MTQRSPFSHGQLSLWRDIEHVPADRRQQVNIGQVWELPSDVSTERAEMAWAKVVAHHATLRTTYDLSDPVVPHQVVGNHHAELTLTTESTGDVLAASLARAFDPERDVLVRAHVVTKTSVATHLVLVNHHLAADAAAQQVLREDFLSALDGELSDPPLGPADLASLEHSGSGRRRSHAAVAHWMSALADLPQVLEPTGEGALCHLSLASHEALVGVTARSRATGISPANVVLAAYVGALQDTGSSDVLMRVMSSNRFDARRERVVTSMNQWTVMRLASTTRDLSPEEMARHVTERAMPAFRHGVHDVDVLGAALRERGLSPQDLVHAWSYNFIRLGPGLSGPVVADDGEIHLEAAPQTAGPRLYLRAVADDRLTLLLRVPDESNWHDRGRAVLHAMRRILTVEATS